MYKDALGNYIEINSVVKLNGNFYSVIGFDSTKQCSVELANGSIHSQAAPEQLICIDGAKDLKYKMDKVQLIEDIKTIDSEDSNSVVVIFVDVSGMPQSRGIQKMQMIKSIFNDICPNHKALILPKDVEIKKLKISDLI